MPRPLITPAYQEEVLRTLRQMDDKLESGDSSQMASRPPPASSPFDAASVSEDYKEQVQLVLEKTKNRATEILEGKPIVLSSVTDKKLRPVSSLLKEASSSEEHEPESSQPQVSQSKKKSSFTVKNFEPDGLPAGCYILFKEFLMAGPYKSESIALKTIDEIKTVCKRNKSLKDPKDELK